MNKIVNDYRIVLSGDEYTAPECRRFHLQGECAWIHSTPANKMTSSPIVSVKGRMVTTRSGTIYILGKRAEGFQTFSQMRKKHPGVPLT